MKRKMSLGKKIAITAVALLLLLVGGFLIYSLDYYRASADVSLIVEQSPLRIETADHLTVIYPTGNNLDKGIIFYPGGKVEANAYLPLLVKLSELGYTTVLVEMPLNLAVFNSNGAEEAFTLAPEIKDWYLAGHSLGGAMASSYMEDHYDQFKGLILLASYPLNDAPIETLVLYGTYDQVLDQSTLEGVENKVEIIGGNHAYFGNYGEQEGDGIAIITREEQQAFTAKAIHQFINP